MGCCFSDESSEQTTDPDERSRLLPDVARNQEPQYSAVDASPSPDSHRKTDEVSALKRILMDTANNVIDVAQLENSSVEQHEYTERARQYSTRLAMRCSLSQTLHHTCSHALPPGVAAPATHLASAPLSAADILFITQAANQAAKLVSEVKVKHKEDLVVPFGVP